MSRPRSSGGIGAHLASFVASELVGCMERDDLAEQSGMGSCDGAVHVIEQEELETDTDEEFEDENSEDESNKEASTNSNTILKQQSRRSDYEDTISAIVTRKTTDTLDMTGIENSSAQEESVMSKPLERSVR